MPLNFLSGINFDSGRIDTVSFGTNDLPAGSKSGDDYFNEKGVDMTAMGDPKLMPQSSGLNCRLGTFAMPVESSDWEGAPASAVLAHATNLPSMKELFKNTPEFARMTVILFSEDGIFPKTYIFHTREGGAGILQITGFTENPRGVKIRYKLVQNGQASAANYPGDWIWEANSQTLERVPPMFLLRPSTLPANATPFDMMGKDRYLARGKTLQELIECVWSQKNSALPLFFVAKLPDDKFDFIVTDQPRWWDKLETEINGRFHLFGQIETHGGREMVVVKNANN